MKVTNLRVNHLTNPMGYQMDQPLFTWVTSNAKGSFQKSAQIQIALDNSFENIVFDSSNSEEISSLGYKADIRLKPHTRYYWRVQVWDDADDHGISDTAWFETGKMEEEWNAKWIGTPYDGHLHPYIRNEFHIPGKIKSARAYVSGLGLYELEINGEKCGDEYLAPFYNDYNEWVQYQTLDVTECLWEGKNVVGALLGNGWYKGRFGFVDKMDQLYGNSFAFICELDIVLETGEHISIGSDETWQCHPSPIVSSSIYDGEIYDALQEVKDWSAVQADTEGFENACVLTPQCGALKERLSPPLVITKRINPIQLLDTLAGEKVLDFGQEVTGWVEFDCHLRKGAKVKLSYAELLQDDNFYNENLRTAKAEYTYRSNGELAHVRPHFTFYGFRFVKVEGVEDIKLDDFTACVIHSDLEQTGNIRTSNQKINRLFENAMWSQRGNFLDVPTDCPQRDERMGWTGDAQVFCATASFNMYTPAFYKKFLYEMYLEQKNQNGSVPHVVPDVLGQIAKIQGQENDAHGSCAWGDAACVIPWTEYLFYGDKELLAEQFKNMKAWVDYIKTQDETYCGGKRLWEHGFHFADWLALDNPDKKSSFGGTNPYYVASGYYYYSASLTAKAAEVLGFAGEQKYYERLTEEVKTAIQQKYFSDGNIIEDTQTALVMSLYMGFVPENQKTQVIERLKKKLDDKKCHLDTGFVGTPYLCPTLSKNGLNDYAYTLLLNEDFPSWLYEVNMGATTIWERWNSVLPNGYVSDTGMNSMNHYSYGSIVEWMYRYMCGLNPVESHPGFKEVVIKPQTDDRLGWVECEYLSAAGLYKISWKIEQGKTTYHVSVPFDSQAKFVLPKASSQATINGEYNHDLVENSEVMLSAGDYKIITVG
ncbi:family 78 glycoside hydrolase catalytic domain [Blautia liquoris]|uniref:alpha-L-rhamnosidase n=1 Tax=Blautia liquoris TaxID=2779518 RepID=A0A7M2RGJ1_9FIRM|nr:family 78 glycoside hydrolase catalytic domain [Blautia liquoris]QOV18450.1 family 78 glycoside hydrolase catalytic domain [Blautia liquoris]